MSSTYRQAGAPAISAQTSTASLPLAGIRIMEFSHMVMGPSAGMILADLGADVIKIEPAPDGDPTRRLKDVAVGFFPTYNRNKRSLAIDLKAPEGCAVVQKLAAQADILIENYSPRTMDRLGCGYEELSGINPRLVYCSLKGFLSGPYEHRMALDEVVQYMGGLAYMTGPPGEPRRAGASVIDIMGGMFAVIAIQAALRERERSGRGQLIKSALFETTAFLMGQHMVRAQVTGVSPAPTGGKRAGVWTIYDPFETADGKKIFLGIISDNHWRRFCEKFGRPDLVSDPRYNTNADRVKERDTILPLVSGIIARYTQAELIELLDHLGCPFAPVATPSDLIEDPHLNANGRLLDVETPAGGNAKIPRLPLEMNGHALGLRRQPATVGQHTAEILTELGLTRTDIDDLCERNIVRCG
ncbi:CaiB/BaiF CoA transferase family protein [Bradyrhizobium mercantei]|uniref:CaiB/BaiF CoA transferase family protein n=1 Tax=Bradyrhizobium mercantei TaxID=1904807 RepID=UPI000978819C|nr:CaiB/BaiF CoA-transferase family protein [Bradyrhizobium mercantei]